MPSSPHLPRTVFFFFLCVLVVTACSPLHIVHTPTITSQNHLNQTTTTPIATLPTTPTSAITISEAELRNTKVTLWHPWIGYEKATLDNLVEEFNKANSWGITVQPVSIPGIDLLDQQIQNVWASEDSPELIIAFRFQAQNWQKIKPLVMNWQDYISDSSWGISEEETSTFIPALWETNVNNEFRWGIPARRVGQTLFFNASLAKELGFSSAPSTPEIFQKQACAASLLDPQTNLPIRSGWYLSQDYPSILSWLVAFGSHPVSEDGLSYRWDTTEVRQAFTYLRNLYDGGCTITLSDVSPTDALAQRRALFISSNTGDILSIQQAFQQNSSRDQWTAIPFPSSAEPFMLTYGVDYILLKSTAPQQLASWLFVKWMLSSEAQREQAERTLSLPLRTDVIETLKTNPSLPPAYRAVLNYLPNAITEPNLASWNTVRWVVGDASKQLFAWYFSVEQVPTLSKLLQDTAQSFETTPTPIPTPTHTP